jgi:hypothetical protein
MQRWIAWRYILPEMSSNYLVLTMIDGTWSLNDTRALLTVQDIIWKIISQMFRLIRSSQVHQWLEVSSIELAVNRISDAETRVLALLPFKSGQSFGTVHVSILLPALLAWFYSPTMSLLGWVCILWKFDGHLSLLWRLMWFPAATRWHSLLS